MANCSIRNSSPASGRISTRSLRQSRRQNRQQFSFGSVIRHSAFTLRKRLQVRHVESVPWPRRIGTLQTSLCAREIRCWTLSIESREFSEIRRVKGAWWPSRSSKPSSPRKWRGRFDSYPLRQISSPHPERRAAKSKDPTAISTADSSEFLDVARNYKLVKGGEPDVA
jgi:hypothetical protein